MKKSTTITSLLTASLLLSATSGFCQSAAAQKEADPRVVAAESQDPATFKSDETYTTEWPVINEKDVLWRKRVWRTIDLTDPKNAFFSTGTIGATLQDILLAGLRSGAYKVYSGRDDRFTEEISYEKANVLLSDPESRISPAINPGTVKKFMIKEDWMLLKDGHKKVVRIIGIAPVLTSTGPDGNSNAQPVFWLYYPHIRKHLAGQKVNAKSIPAHDLDEVFEGRYFESTINKVAAAFSAKM